MTDSVGVAALYPYLDLDGGSVAGGPDGRPGPDAAELAAELVSTVASKVLEAAALRQDGLSDEAQRLGACAKVMAERFAVGGRLLAFGNGGSATDCQAVASLYLQPPSGQAFPCLSLSAEPAVLSALANDIGFDVVFARQLAALAKTADIAMGISTSGNSENLCRAFDEAARLGLVTVGLAGYEGGRMAELGTIDFLFVVPSTSVHRIQEGQTTLLHAMWTLVHSATVPGGARP